MRIKTRGPNRPGHSRTFSQYSTAWGPFTESDKIRGAAIFFNKRGKSLILAHVATGEEKTKTSDS